MHAGCMQIAKDTEGCLKLNANWFHEIVKGVMRPVCKQQKFKELYRCGEPLTDW